MNDSGQESTSDTQPSIVEDFGYPGAAQIQATDNVQLISGDGHIVYTDCPSGPDTVGLIMVHTSNLVGPNGDGKLCFHVLAASGYLTMMIADVYSIRGDGLQAGQGHKLKAALTTDAGVHTVVDVNPSGTTQVGITTDPPGDPTTLLRLDASS
ncbi:hypothetical protein [Amycolatopsis sp. GM8]|uniref:hypothetical protein n=1 Tax=Amycolatopsis sp. GM8 TaxID=2896530 RepID=UPI001F22E684|nr:hypothetical protein [Amycolatopsis sp. GM8]